MEQGQDPPLRLPVEIDQQVAARDQVEARKRRIAEQVMLSEYYSFTQFLLDLVGVVERVEETP
jgi:hypothetical protein